MTSPSPKQSAKKFQSPKGTRDFYPQDMAVRRYIESVWRKVSINHGFDEVEGPMFEDIELYKHKSGPGIVSEIFQVFSGKDEKELASIRAGSDAPFALRPEFTPTLARMVAAKAAELPRPIKWFAIPQHFRAERPQRGRLREFMQWNVDFIGDATPQADAEVIATAVSALEMLGLTSNDIKVKLTDRNFVTFLLQKAGIPDEKLNVAFELLDKRSKLTTIEFAKLAQSEGFDAALFDQITDREKRMKILGIVANEGAVIMSSDVDEAMDPLHAASESLDECGLEEWYEIEHTIVRGLAYYTGTVFEIHETTGAERAIAGGGRYDNLIESFGGPSLPACGFGMGDVVLANILHDKDLLPEDVYMKPLRPHAFAVVADDSAEPIMRQTVAQLRRDGFHVRHSYKTTRNVGKLLGDASKCGALSAIIFGKDIAAQQVEFKDLQSGEQSTIALADVKERLKELIAKHE